MTGFRCLYAAACIQPLQQREQGQHEFFLFLSLLSLFVTLNPPTNKLGNPLIALDPHSQFFLAEPRLDRNDMFFFYSLSLSFGTHVRNGNLHSSSRYSIPYKGEAKLRLPRARQRFSSGRR